jgi:DNA-directed RNA polymerase subunit RPC12/RpoP
MVEEKGKKHTGKCFDCGGPLELVELDIKKATKIMQCQNCGLFHFYKKDFFGKYSLLRVTKNPDTEIS